MIFKGIFLVFLEREIRTLFKLGQLVWVMGFGDGCSN